MGQDCFVCNEKGEEEPLYRSPCRCGMPVHSACLLSVIQKVPSHATSCPVCKADYEGVSRDTYIVPKVSLCLLLSYFLTALVWGCFGVVVWCSEGYVGLPFTVIRLFAACVSCVVLIYTIALHMIFSERSGRRLCCWKEKVVDVKVDASLLETV